MLATLTVAVLTCAGSVLVGEALARLLGLARWRGWSPAVGLALLIAVALAAVKLPGHGTTGAFVLAALVVAAAVVVASGGIPAPPWHVGAITGTSLLAAFVPHISNERVGVPAVGFTNDPVAHFIWIDNLRNIPANDAVVPGYPIGPHSLMAALADGTGIAVEWVFTGLLVALPVLIAWAALPLLAGLRPARLAIGAILVAFAYTVSAFYAQAGFKELLLTLFLVAALAIARAEASRGGTMGARSGIQVGLLCGAIVTSFSYGGLAWPVLTVAAWVGMLAALALLRGHRRGLRALAGDAARWLRRVMPAVVATAATAALAVVADLTRLIESLSVFGSSPASVGTIETENVGHLAGEVSKREIFGFWAREDFRFMFERTLANDLLALLAPAIAVFALLWWLWRRDLAVPAAVGAAVLIAIRLSDIESPYTASKALAPAGALVMAMSARAILAVPTSFRLPGVRWLAAAVAVVFVGSALWSSFLALRGGHVGPREHPGELRELERRLDGQPVTFLGIDDYAPWLLRDSSPFVLPGTRPAKQWEFHHPIDFDTVDPPTLDAAPFVIVTRTSYRSEPRPNLRLAHSTPSYELWERRGPTPYREVLESEGPRPGAILDCSDAQGRALARQVGWARVWSEPPIVVDVPDWARTLHAGDSGTASVFLPRGRWEMSLPYTSPQRLSVSLGRGDRGSVPPNLDRPGPIWRIADITQREPGRRSVRLHVEEDALGSENHPALLSWLAFVRVDAPRRLIPLSEACGRYVDWYTLGPERPAVPPGAG